MEGLLSTGPILSSFIMIFITIIFNKKKLNVFNCKMSSNEAIYKKSVGTGGMGGLRVLGKWRT